MVTEYRMLKNAKVSSASVECQTPKEWMTNIGGLSINATGENDNSSEMNSSKISKRSSLTIASIMKGKKEKPMGLQNTMNLIPDIYHEYCLQLLNPAEVDKGKHINLIEFTKKSLIRKYGVKQIANKNFKAFLVCLIANKNTNVSRNDERKKAFDFDAAP
jgi:hypothetical protein